jgi:hypothetical protein
MCNSMKCMNGATCGITGALVCTTVLNERHVSTVKGVCHLMKHGVLARC